MKIDPKTYTLDANQRNALTRALYEREGTLLRSIIRKQTSRHAWTDAVKREIASLEIELAHVQDVQVMIA